MNQTLYLTHLHADTLQWLVSYVLPLVAILPSLLLGFYLYRASRFLRTILLAALQGAVYYGLVKYSAGRYLHALYERLVPVYGDRVPDRVSDMLSTSLSLTDSLFLYVLPAFAHGIMTALIAWLALAILAPDRHKIF